MKSPNVRVHVLTQRVRFTEPLLIAGHMQIACGPLALGAEAEQLRQLASAKVFDDDTYVHTATGNNKRVMEIHNEKAWVRARRLGESEANGGVVHYKDEAALAAVENRSIASQDLQKLRGYGFEEQVFVRGERYLVSVKERDPGATTPAMTVGGATRAHRRAVTNLEVATLVSFEHGADGRLSSMHVHVEGTPAGETMQVWRASHSRPGAFGRSVKVESFPLKPFYERYAKLYQGLQFDEFHVDTTKWNPKAWGLLGMAVSRVKVCVKGVGVGGR